MKTGDVVFIRGKSLISKAIQFLDRGEFSHVAIFVSDDEVIEAEYSTRVRIVKFEYEDYEVIPMNLSAEEAAEVRVLAENFKGSRYDYLAIIYLWLRLALKITLGRVDTPKQVTCSELVGYILLHIGRGTEGISSFTPNELYRFLKKENAQRRG